ncbi:slipin family protein [Sessilibacter corallicola]|nr:slipin family protein [Sessilibacter corallicola]MCE2029054.1 slipin family protein [Sessilibacter corallicola]
MFYKILSDNERGLLFVDNNLTKILGPGKHWLVGWGKRINVEVYDITRVVFEHEKLAFFLKNNSQLFEPFVDVIKLTDDQVGIVYLDGNFHDIINPGTLYVTWKGSQDIKVKVLSLSEGYQVPDQYVPIIGSVRRSGNLRKHADAILFTDVPEGHIGLLYVDGKFEKTLANGWYGFWKYNHLIAIKLIDLRVQNIDVSGQEILTKDRVSVRINLSANYKVVDPELATAALKDFNGFMYLELQLLLREAVGTKLLDELLEDKSVINDVVYQGAIEKLGSYGIELISVGVKDIILPGDMKLILNQVVQAQKEAEANLIKRKEETQAMRSMHNTAKVMENNPMIIRLKELEALERITTKIDTLTVYGGLDGVLNNLIQINQTPQN